MHKRLTSTVPLVAALICAIAIAACGGSSPSASNATASSASSTQVKFADCMRSHGVPDFPDLSSGPTQLQQTPNGGGSVTVNGHKLAETPAEFQKAQQECAKYQPTNKGPTLSASQLATARTDALKMAKCMRAHGVPDFPDPTVSTGPGGKGISIGIHVSAGAGGAGNAIDPQSPAFQAAQKICMPIMAAALPGAKKS